MKGTPIDKSIADYCLAHNIISKKVDQNFSLDQDSICTYCGKSMFIEKGFYFYIAPPLCVCPACHKLMDFSRPYDHKTLPAMHSDERPFPRLSNLFTPLLENHPNRELIELVLDNLDLSILPQFHKIPGMLKHFTSDTNANSILQSGEIWAMQASTLSDTNEILHAQSLIREVYNELKPIFTEEQIIFIERGLATLLDTTENEKYFVLCFTHRSTSPYHWKNYAYKDKGVSLGFHPGYLGLNSKVHLRRVIYNRNIQKQLVGQVFASITDLYTRCKLWSPDYDYELSLATFASLIDNQLRQFLFTFKGINYELEDEYRVIVQSDAYNTTLVKKVPFNGKKYIPMKLEQTSNDIKKLPITGVFLGKEISRDVANNVLRSVLDNSYGHILLFDYSAT